MPQYQRCTTRTREWFPRQASRPESWDAKHLTDKRRDRFWLSSHVLDVHVIVEPKRSREVGVPRQLEEKFSDLAQRWRNQVKTMSSTTDRVLHSAYQDVIGMGKPVLPLILRELERNGGHWFWALRHISHENPVPPQDAGNIGKMREAWLRWGRENRYL